MIHLNATAIEPPNFPSFVKQILTVLMNSQIAYHLGCQERLPLFDGFVHGFFLRSFGEGGWLKFGLGAGLLLDHRARDLSQLGRCGTRAGSNEIRGLVAVVIQVLFDNTCRVGRSLFDQVLQLIGMGVDDRLGFFDVSVDHFTMVHVGERAEVSNGDDDQRQAPERKEFDQPVGIQSTEEGLQNCQIVRSSNRPGHPG